jgi:ATP-dependent helicase YprA (DUF1998 family)
MNAISDLLKSFLQPYLESPLLASLGSLLAIPILFMLGRALYRVLEQLGKQLSPGPVFMFGALLVTFSHALLLGYFAATDRTFEEATIAWLADFTGLPLGTLGVVSPMMLLPVMMGLLGGAYLLTVLITAWAIGLFGGEEGGVARELEDALGTSYAMRFYQLCGYHRPDAIEKRFHAWALPLSKALRWAMVLSFPGALTGAIPVALWVAGAVFYDGLKRTLTAPAAAPEEEARADEKVEEAPPALRDPAQLLEALQRDPRGPKLSALGSGTVQGLAEHAAERTRVAEESAVIGAVLEALGIERFFVHQEAAAEAVLSDKDVLLETPPLSGRRTLCDVLAMREVLLEAGTVLYLCPTLEESARRAEAFAAIANQSNWRWAIYHRDISPGGRVGLDLGLRQPQIVFTTPEQLHRDICRLHRDWDYFLGSLGLVVTIDLDRYTGPRGTNLMFIARRLARVAEAAGARPRWIATVAPYGPDVQGFAERLLGRPLTVIGPESDSRGAPSQWVLVGEGEDRALHPAVSARGVAIACGYHTELWGHEEVLTDFEEEQQVNKVLLEFSRAVIASGDATDLRFEKAHAVVVHLSAGDAAMIPFFTRHVGRAVLEVPKLAAQEVGKRGPAVRERSSLPFAGFERPEDRETLGPAKKQDKDAKIGEADGAKGEAIALEDDPNVALLTAQPELAVSIWLAAGDAFAQLLARHPTWIHPASLHPMLVAGARLVASADSPVAVVRHLLCAAAEAPITREEAAQSFSLAALDAALKSDHEPWRLETRPRLRLDDEGVIERSEELLLDGEVFSRGSSAVASADVARLVNRAGGEVVLECDAVRIATTAYPGRVLVRGGRRYRVLLPDEQARRDEGVMWAEPERRRAHTERLRTVALTWEGAGHHLGLGGPDPVRLLHARVDLEERVVGVRRREGGVEDALLYEEAMTAHYTTRAALVELPAASDVALEGLERLARVVLPAFVRHGEDDIDVAIVRRGEAPVLAFIDRHPGGTGFGRAVGSEVLRHVFYWSREIVALCGKGGCEIDDGCRRCVRGAPRLSAEVLDASRTETASLLERIIGRAAPAPVEKAPPSTRAAPAAADAPAAEPAHQPSDEA